MFSFIADCLTRIVSILLPIFASYKALRSSDSAHLRRWLIHWSTLSLLLLLEHHFSFLLSCFPFYAWARFALHLYLVFPGRPGSVYIYKAYIYPFLREHERLIDNVIADVLAQAKAAGWDIVRQSWEYVRYRRSAAPSLPYDKGRPPTGALTRRRYTQDRELRDPRFEELDSEEQEEEAEDDEQGQGVVLDPRARRGGGGFESDELYFDGYDVGRDRISRRQRYDSRGYEDDLDSDEVEFREQRMLAYHAHTDKEEQLIQSALERIARARAKGKTNVNLSAEEMEALERRRGDQQPEPASTPLASPSATPAKPAARPKAGSRSNSATNLATQKTRKRGSTGMFGGAPSPAKPNSKARVDRMASPEQALPYPYPTGQAPPGVMVPGPNGTQVYAPIGYYGPPSPELGRGPPGNSRPNSKPGSRSASKHNRRESMPPERSEAYPQLPPRYYPPPPPALRPESSGSNRSLPDDIDWYPPPPALPRNRSASNAQYAGYPSDYEQQALSMPAAQGRRHVSGPAADGRYATLRRVPPSSPLAARPLPAHASQSDPSVIQRRQNSGLSQEVGDSSRSNSSSSDDQGVQVDIVPDGAGGSGYSVNRALIPAPGPQSMALTVSGNEGRKRRGAWRREREMPPPPPQQQ